MTYMVSPPPTYWPFHLSAKTNQVYDPGSGFFHQMDLRQSASKYQNSQHLDFLQEECLVEVQGSSGCHERQ